MTVLDAREAYRKWAPTYEQENPVTALDCLLVERHSCDPAGLRLLDVGCGTGRRLAGTGATRAVGVEPCIEMLEVGREARTFGPEIELVEGDARALPLDDGSFDLVWCRLAIGHIADHAAVYEELGRVTAPGGQVLVTDFHPAAAAAGMRRTFKADDTIYEVEHHIHGLGEQIDAAQAAGLSLAKIEEAKIGPEVRHFYQAAGRLDLYEAQCGAPLVYALIFSRDG